jgi:hypothetical protein
MIAVSIISSDPLRKLIVEIPLVCLICYLLLYLSILFSLLPFSPQLSFLLQFFVFLLFFQPQQF